ncbi:DUF4189 domain-containing protein [Cohaesibacter celericrescens]|uniref:DUF4189 domain-containing protein n=1 Tax=Cohaesibacter celericrescens TaxID=2067669 RepID=A0A2N5XVA8_9HYPH|nr:DUF4189 domain-containing protein [Cohaesibacter celericrescens]PLW78443.1 hypothetical protein C0081_04965 [Cohaesibacter celericrescens]
MFHRICLFIVSIILSTLLTSGASAQDYYGAIAVASNGAHGYSFDYNTKRQAQNRALSECRQQGRNCKVALWFRNACGVLAMNRQNSWATAWGDTRRYAEQLALRSCNNKYGGCFVKRWVCTAGR